MIRNLSFQIYKAASNQDHDELAMLMSNAQSDVINSEGLRKSALDVSASQGDYIAVELLLAHGAVPDYKRPEHVWPKSTLSRAIMSGNHKVIELLVNRGCDPDTKLDIFSKDNRRRDNSQIPQTISHNYWYKVVERNYLSIFQLLLKCKDRKIINDKWGQDMLMLACYLGSYAIIDYLLSQGVSTESIDENGWTSLFYGVANRNIDVIELLLARGANINHKDFKGCNALHIGVLYQKSNNSLLKKGQKILKLFINKGVDINATDINGLTPINMAFTVKIADVCIIFYLLSQGNIDLAKPDINGVTPLHRAVSVNSLLTYKDLLYALDVDINARDNEGKTPLQSINNFDTIRNIWILLQLGADSKDLYYYSKNGWLKNNYFLKLLEKHRLQRKIANFSNDLNIDNILAEKCVLSIEEHDELIEEFSKEIEQMKKTILCDGLTYYDFLHARKRALSRIVNPGMHEMFTKSKHGFYKYGIMLCKNYLSGARPLTSNESKAMNNVEKNLNVIFNNKLPNLVTYNIKKYIDIEDMVILDNM